MRASEFIKRLFMFNVVIFIIYQNMVTKDMTTTFNHFKKSTIFLGEKLNLRTEALKNLNLILSAQGVWLLKEKGFLVYEIILGSLAFLSLLSIFTNKKIFPFMFTLLFELYSFVKYNPLLPENINQEPYGIRKELILSVGIGIVMLVNVFNNAESPKVEVVEKEKKTN